jgi:cytochrome P450
VDSRLAIEDFDDADFNPFIISESLAKQGEVADIYPELRRLRHISPLHEMDPRVHFGTAPDGTLDGRKKWTALGSPLVNQMLTDTATFSNRNYERNMGLMFGRSITTMDPPEHRSFRTLFQKAFAPNMLGEWRDNLVPKLVNELIDNFAGRGHAELIGEFSLHFPFMFVMELLDLPLEYRTIFHRLAFCQTAVRYDREHALEAGNKLTKYIRGMIAQRRDNPVSDTDFVHVLANAEVDGKHIPADVLEAFFRQLMNAAGDTSYHGFSCLTAALLSNPDQLEAVRSDRALVAQAIEEGLRWEPPIALLERMVHNPTEIAGHMVMPEDHIFLAIGDANHDESVVPDPDRFDIFRKRTRTVSFGSGPHICIGQHLARLEMTIALNTLLDRLPNLRINPDYPEPVVHGVSMRKPKAVQVLFDS